MIMEIYPWFPEATYLADALWDRMCSLVIAYVIHRWNCGDATNSLVPIVDRVKPGSLHLLWILCQDCENGGVSVGMMMVDAMMEYLQLLFCWSLF